MKDARAKARLIKEIAVLGSVALLLVAFTLLRGLGAPQTKPASTAPPLNTEFDTDALEAAKAKDTNYPDVDDSDVGKTDPFAP